MFVVQGVGQRPRGRELARFVDPDVQLAFGHAVTQSVHGFVDGRGRDQDRLMGRRAGRARALEHGQLVVFVRRRVGRFLQRPQHGRHLVRQRVLGAQCEAVHRIADPVVGLRPRSRFRVNADGLRSRLRSTVAAGLVLHLGVGRPVGLGEGRLVVVAHEHVLPTPRAR